MQTECMNILSERRSSFAPFLWCYSYSPCKTHKQRACSDMSKDTVHCSVEAVTSLQQKAALWHPFQGWCEWSGREPYPQMPSHWVRCEICTRYFWPQHGFTAALRQISFRGAASHLKHKEVLRKNTDFFHHWCKVKIGKAFCPSDGSVWKPHYGIS